MAKTVAILHGWSDRSASFVPLRAFLAQNGYVTAELWLGDYISMDDDVRVEDVAKRMQAVIAELQAAGQLAARFDLIVHSTGGLVAREWIATFYPDGQGCPVKRLVMLAPANFGSRLAALGKSMIGRLTKGLANRLQTGEEMLRALELASPYQWDLARRDLLAPPGQAANGPYGAGRIWPFVIVGTRAYDSGLRQIVNENGSDGTVRVAAANLNVAGYTIDFTPAGPPAMTAWGDRMRGAEAPLAVLPERDHGEVIQPGQTGGAAGAHGARLGQLILSALACPDDAAYAAMAGAWRAISDETAALAEQPANIPVVFGGADNPRPEHFHRYMQVVVKVRDDYGAAVGDYFLEFAAREVKGERTVISFHRDVLEHVHVNSVSSALRCLYLDHTDMMGIFYRDRDWTLGASISAAPPGRNVKYFDSKQDKAQGQIALHAADLDKREALPARLRRNSTHLIEVVIPRRPVDKVFQLSR